MPWQRPFFCRPQGHLGSERHRPVEKRVITTGSDDKCPSVCLPLGVIRVHILCPDMLLLTPSPACGACLSAGVEQSAPGLPTPWLIVGPDEARGIPSCFLLGQWPQDAEQFPVWWVLDQESPQGSQPFELGKNPHCWCEISCKPLVQNTPKGNLYAKYVCWGDCLFIPASKPCSWDPKDTGSCSAHLAPHTWTGDTLYALLRLLLK